MNNIGISYNFVSNAKKIWQEKIVKEAIKRANADLVTDRYFTAYTCCICAHQFILTRSRNISLQEIHKDKKYNFQKLVNRSGKSGMYHTDIFKLHKTYENGRKNNNSRYVCWYCLGPDWLYNHKSGKWSYNPEKKQKELKAMGITIIKNTKNT